MTCEPFCDSCGGNLGHPANGDFTCDKCKRKGRKERIRKDEFSAGNPAHFRLQTRGGAWRYYRKVDAPVVMGIDLAKPGSDVSVRVGRRDGKIVSIERLD